MEKERIKSINLSCKICHDFKMTVMEKRLYKIYKSLCLGVINMNEISINDKKIPNKAFDMEYSTQWKKEKEYLSNHGINPVFTKTNEYKVKTYKYKKNSELFAYLYLFWSMIDFDVDIGGMNNGKSD